MAGKVNKRFTVDLEISMGDAEKKIKGTVGNIKTILADLGKASDKMTYFKELADYLSQVDAELDRFKQKHGDGLFNQIFSGLDASLRKEMEDTFGTAKEQLAQLESIRARFDKMKASGATEADLKPLEQELKELYKSLGKLDEAKISGRGAIEKRVQKMEDALNNFAIVWDEVSKKISKGFSFDGVGSGTSAGVESLASDISKFSNEVQQEIDKLNKQIEELKDTKKRLLEVYALADQIHNKSKGYGAIPDSYKSDLTIDSVEQLIADFDLLQKAMKSSEKSSADYYNNLIKMADAALKLKKAMSDIKDDGTLKSQFDDANVWKKLISRNNTIDNVLKEVLGLKTLKGKTIKPIDDIIKAYGAQIASFEAGSTNIKTPKKSDGMSYQKLKKTVEKYYELVQQYKDESLDDNAIEKISDKMEGFSRVITKLANGKEQVVEIQDIFKKLETGSIELEDAFQSIAKILDIIEVGPEIEQANRKLNEFFDIAQRLKELTSLDGADSKSALSKLHAVRDELQQLQEQGAITEQQMREVSDAFNDAKGNLHDLGYNTNGTHSGSSGAGGTITNVDFTDLKDTIKSEASALARKLDNVLKVELVKDNTDIQDALNNIKTSVDKISGVIDNYNASKETSSKQAEVDIMKSNLSKLLSFIGKHNNSVTEQELKAVLMSDKTISVGYGEDGHVTANTKMQTLLSNLTSSLVADIHSHPLAWTNGKPYMNDMFSGSEGDLSATRFSKKLGAKVTSMITGNIMRTFDLTKLTDPQLSKFVQALSDIEKRYAKNPEYSKYVSMSQDGDLMRYHSPNLNHAHKTTEIFESMMYDAFKKIGMSKQQVDDNIFHKFNLTDDEQLTKAATYLVDLSNSAQQAISPLERLKDILRSLGGDVDSDRAKMLFTAYSKGERTAADVFNALNKGGFEVNQATIDSMLKIDTASELSATESLLTNISSVLSAISSSVSNIENNIARNTTDRFDTAMNDIIDVRNGIVNDRMTAGVKSIFDPLNISEYKSQEVLLQADESVLSFKDLLHDAFPQSFEDGINIEALEEVLNAFKVALSNTKDAMKQISLYESRTGEVVYDDSILASTSLMEKYNELIDPTNLEALLYMLSQAKIDINKFKTEHDGGLSSASDDFDVENTSLIIGGIQQIHAILESIDSKLHDFTSVDPDVENSSQQQILDQILGVLQGFTGVEADGKGSIKYKGAGVDDKPGAGELSEKDLSVLTSILESVRNIGEYLRVNKTNKEIDGADKNDPQGSEVLNYIRTKLPHQLATEDTLQAVKAVVDSIYTNLHNSDVKPVVEDDSEEPAKESNTYQLLASKLPHNVASEDTLSLIRDILGQLVDVAKTTDEDVKQDEVLKVQDSLSKLVVSLTSAVKGLQNVTNGLTGEQKIRKTNTSLANARIANKDTYDQIKSVALNSLGDRAIDSEVTEMKALANGIVQVIGYLQVAENEWEGFTLQVNEANEVSKLAFDKNSKAAKRAAAEAEALRKLSELGSDENRKTYSKEETARRAQVHLDEYTAQGKNATVQLKDNGRYTISILEEIGGLSKQIFQTFDENDDKIERTTATMSNKALVKLQDLQKIAEFGNVSGFVGDGDDVYKKYNDASAVLEKLNALYREQDGLTEEDIASWNTQIKLVQRLGAEVEKLILTRKTAASSDLFASQKKASVNTFDKDYAQLKKSIAIPDSFIGKINTARKALSESVDNESLKIAKNDWAALRAEIEKTAIEQDLYIKKTSSTKTTKKSSYGTTPVANAKNRFRELDVRAQSYVDDGSTVVSNKLQQYKKALEELIALQKTFEGKSEKDLSSEQLEQFTKLKIKCDDYGKSLKKIIDSSDKLKTGGFNGKNLKDDVAVGTYNDRAKALKEYVEETYRSKASIGKLNSDATELSFTFKHTDGSIESMTASLNAARTAIVSTSQSTKQANSLFGDLWNKFKGLGKYAAARFGVDEIFQALRTGVQSVRDIDSALTELKKVTNETDGAYDRFLQNMSKTADVVGSTVKDLTTMAAEWSRLGYSIEESSELAKNTAILMNVSEFDDATEASEALISTMQAFQYTADESGHVVDILNEVKVTCLLIQ